MGFDSPQAFDGTLAQEGAGCSRTHGHSPRSALVDQWLPSPPLLCTTLLTEQTPASQRRPAAALAAHRHQQPCWTLIINCVQVHLKTAHWKDLSTECRLSTRPHLLITDGLSCLPLDFDGHESRNPSAFFPTALQQCLNILGSPHSLNEPVPKDEASLELFLFNLKLSEASF